MLQLYQDVGVKSLITLNLRELFVNQVVYYFKNLHTKFIFVLIGNSSSKQFKNN